MAYYQRIRELREDHDLTQRDLAAMLHMPQPQYWRYEQGYRDIPSDILIQLSKLYHVSTDYILGLVPKDIFSKVAEESVVYDSQDASNE